jgi:starch synthase
MIASRYAAIPVVRETGGLYDTIKPFNPETGEGNGVTFFSYNAHDMLAAIRRAIALWQDDATRKKLLRNVITADFSWNASAEKYADLYKGM